MEKVNIQQLVSYGNVFFFFRSPCPVTPRISGPCVSYGKTVISWLAIAMDIPMFPKPNFVSSCSQLDR